MAEKKKSVDIHHSKVRINVSSKKPSATKKTFYWIIAIIIFYVLTTAAVSSEVVEVEKKTSYPEGVKETVVVEKIVKTTKYREDRIPFGPTRCEQFTYNFSKTYNYAERIEGSNKIVTCTFIIKNEEDIAGNFTFYPQILKNGKINDGSDMTKRIAAFGTAKFEWNFTMEPFDSASCMLQIENPPHRIKCIYLEPITYQIKQVPYTVEEKKNVTEERIVKYTIQKQNVTQNVYTNRFFGYRQFFYFGY